MGLSFTIGEAVVETEVDKEFDNAPSNLMAYYSVEKTEHPDAPSFEGDELTGKSNCRSPSYSVWFNFCAATGLKDLFYCENKNNLKARHPGCVLIDQKTVDTVTDALKEYSAKATLPPGFELDYGYGGPPNYDYHLARLMWLTFWVRWAFDNCDIPAIQNT